VNFGANTGYPDTFPAIGDVDGDTFNEVVVVMKMQHGSWVSDVKVLSGDGTEEVYMTATTTVPYGTAPALADLDDDGIPEIIVQTEGAVDVWYGDGTPFPGWPATWGSGYWVGNSSPVVGDIDCDFLPEIAITSQVAGSGVNGYVRVFEHDGTSHPDFPMAMPIGSGAVPAIADFDLDGTNELIITGSYWSGSSGTYDKCWAFELCDGPCGAIEWGQFGHDPGHTGRYEQPGTQPTGTPQPTETPEPTETPTPSFTPTPDYSPTPVPVPVTGYPGIVLLLLGITFFLLNCKIKHAGA